MKARFSRLFLTGGHLAVLRSGWLLGGWTETFADYWHRTQQEAARRFARDEGVLTRA